MARLRAFAFEAGESALHRTDPRVKLAVLAAFSIAAVSLPEWPARAVLLATLLGAFAAAGINLLRALAAARFFLFLAAAVVLSNALSGGRISPAGAELGAQTAAGFLLVVLAAELVLRTTSAARVTDVVHWVLRPVPGVNAGRIALMAGLALRHAVVLSDTYHRVTEAMAVRGVPVRRRPLRSLHIIAVALIRDTVLEAQNTTDALVARGYRDERTPPSFRFAGRDILALVLAVLAILAAVGAARPFGP